MDPGLKSCSVDLTERFSSTTAHVDAEAQLLHRLAERGLALVLVEHDLDLVQQVADFVYVMTAGRIIASGPPAEVIARPEVRAVVLGSPT